MKLHTYLTEQAVCLDLRGKDKAEAIAELAERLRDHPAVLDFDEFLAAMFAREKQSSTGIGRGIAIPHARTDSVTAFVAGVGQLRTPIDFDAVDGQPVNLVILMGIPQAQVKPYLRLLAHLSLLLKRDGFVKSLLEAQEPGAVIRAFEAHEE